MSCYLAPGVLSDEFVRWSQSHLGSAPWVGVLQWQATDRPIVLIYGLTHSYSRLFLPPFTDISFWDWVEIMQNSSGAPLLLLLLLPSQTNWGMMKSRVHAGINPWWMVNITQDEAELLHHSSVLHPANLTLYIDLAASIPTLQGNPKLLMPEASHQANNHETLGFIFCQQPTACCTSSEVIHILLQSSKLKSTTHCFLPSLLAAVATCWRFSKTIKPSSHWMPELLPWHW